MSQTNLNIPQNEIIPIINATTVNANTVNPNTESTNHVQDCFICAMPYNKKMRLPIKCPYCDFESCRDCSQKYILEQPVAKCMNPECGKEWTRKFLCSSFTTKFINKTYKEARERILYEHEISLLPATQYLVEREIKKENISVEITKLHNKQNEIRKKIYELQNQYHRISQDQPIDPSEQTTYVRKCSDPECRGFLSSQWKCGVCTKWTCSKCHENIGTDKNADHSCNPDNVASAKLISKDTKPCPKCRTNIFKIDGCDQMWCTQCNTAFSWRTGQILLDEIHNPHYFEWMRSHGGIAAQQTRQGNCNNRLDITRFYNQEHTAIAEEMRLCIDIYRNLVHLRRVEIPRFNYDKTIPNRNLRVDYMRNFINDEKFKLLLQQNDKKHQKHKNITNILTMLHDTVNDIFIRLLGENIVITRAILMKYMGEIEEIVKYANECLEEVSTTYGSVRYIFNNKLQMHK